VALCGAVGREDRPKRTHQSIDAAAVMKTVIKFTGEITDSDNAPEAVAYAFRAATTRPRGVVAILPREVLDAPTPARCCWKRSGLAHVQ
jgi:acetolactate synthase-1/2/3 large subunit